MVIDKKCFFLKKINFPENVMNLQKNIIGQKHNYRNVLFRNFSFSRKYKEFVKTC